jgi:hypothetical protein
MATISTYCNWKSLQAPIDGNIPHTNDPIERRLKLLLQNYVIC